MSVKEELLRLKNKLIGSKTKQVQLNDVTTVEESTATKERYQKMLDDFYEMRGVSRGDKALANYFNSSRNIDLNTKVDDFIDWHFKTMIKGHYTDIGEFSMQNDMRNFIEKMAVWYELRYPDYEINRLMSGSGQEPTEINDVMFNSNKYINELFDENADVRALDWNEFYNSKAFINSLSWDERYLFERPRYRDLVYIDSQRRSAHLHLTSKGFVELAEEIESYTNFKVKDDELKGMHIKDVVNLLKEKGISLPSGNELEETIKNVENWNYQKEEMLNCVMYRIIERGGNRIGPRRAFLFAKEFGRNIDIPMMYGVDYSDPGLRSFIIEYIKAGGSKDLVCYRGYFSRKSKNEKLDTISIQDLLLTVSNNAVTFYTPEEDELHQGLVNALFNGINQEELKQKEAEKNKETAKRLRIERKLEKSRKAKNQ